ncbi:MAG: cell division protein DedD [Candidatus Magasanikbacteria bacterium CG10_big_fil_rev_8_21_14_0_10_47_10]|uniref:Cell division protein DedD n=1 Tax=Candidatus Magasanikbacteria bacterium CG10_big_fil_rev_8_21_14_0_10_47_10 TaxID=1974652 RepID=A0A2H0TQ86_9BACT|nr:MAG: cell division protein DedD [Candidatus Magasanikbacteria bacterium CG10_big_fil_rev_8_21_14_0_10_47_10]
MHMLEHKRPSWDEYFLEIAKIVGKRSTCDRGRLGCVLARENQILVTGYAGSARGLPHCDEVGHLMKTIRHEDGHESQHCLRTAHAEQNALMQAARIGVPVEGATLYCGMTPCPACAKMLVNAGIRRVVCAKRYHAGEESEEIFRIIGIGLHFIEETVEQYSNQ